MLPAGSLPADPRAADALTFAVFAAERAITAHAQHISYMLHRADPSAELTRAAQLLAEYQQHLNTLRALAPAQPAGDPADARRSLISAYQDLAADYRSHGFAPQADALLEHVAREQAVTGH